MPASESTPCTGKDTPEYRNVNTNRRRITGTLKSNPTASKTLKEKFKEKSWLEPTDDPDEDRLVTLILNRIEDDVNQFQEFIDMLKDIEGTDLIVRILTGMNMHVVLSFLEYRKLPDAQRKYIPVLIRCCGVSGVIPKKGKRMHACVHQSSASPYKLHISFE